MAVSTDEAKGVLAAAQSAQRHGDWARAKELINEFLAGAPDDVDAAWAQAVLAEGYNYEDFKRGLHHREEKHALLDAAEAVAVEAGDDHLLAKVLYERGMALHIEFVMAEPSFERERECFERARELYTGVGDGAGAAMATAMLGIYHHVDHLDRDTAEPILWRAYELAEEAGARIAQSEAARHLGQIRQERGDPDGALELLQQSLNLRREADWPIYVPSALHALAYAKLEAGDMDGAEADLREGRDLAQRLDAPFTLAMLALTEADLNFARLAPGVWKRSHP